MNETKIPLFPHQQEAIDRLNASLSDVRQSTVSKVGKLTEGQISDEEVRDEHWQNAKTFFDSPKFAKAESHWQSIEYGTGTVDLEAHQWLMQHGDELVTQLADKLIETGIQVDTPLFERVLANLKSRVSHAVKLLQFKAANETLSKLIDARKLEQNAFGHESSARERAQRIMVIGGNHIGRSALHAHAAMLLMKQPQEVQIVHPNNAFDSLRQFGCSEFVLQNSFRFLEDDFKIPNFNCNQYEGLDYGSARRGGKSAAAAKRQKQKRVQCKLHGQTRKPTKTKKSKK